MAMQHLSEDREFRYIICWFTEFSELQREDFLPILIEYLTKDNSMPNGNGNGVHVNGMVNAFGNASITNKPMSLFQCRIKLFREWSAKWPLDYKRKLQERIVEIDPKVGEKLTNEIGLSNGSVVENGVETDVVTATVNDDIVNAAVALVNATEEAIISDNRLAAMLNKETSVDDDENDNDGNDNDALQPAGQVQTHVEQASQQEQQLQQLVISTTQTVLNNSAEVPLVA